MEHLEYTHTDDEENIIPIGTPLGEVRIVETYVYYEGPKLILGVNQSGNLFIGTWLAENFEGEFEDWMFLPVSVTRMYMVRSGAISLYDAHRNVEDGGVWKVRLLYKEEGIIPNATFIAAITLEESELPYKESFLNIPTHTIPVINDIKSEALQSRRQVFDLSLQREDVTRSEIPVSILSNTLGEFQKLVNAIFKLSVHQDKPDLVNEQALKLVQLQVTNTFSGSFGIRMQADEKEDLFNYSPIAQVLDSFHRILNIISNLDNINDFAKNTNIKLLNRILIFLKLLNNNKIDIKTKWANYYSSPVSDNLSWRQANDAVNALTKLVESTTNELDIDCTLVAINIENKSFVLVNNEDKSHINGKIGTDIMRSIEDGSSFNIPSKYKASLIEFKSVHELTGEIKSNHILYMLKSA